MMRKVTEMTAHQRSTAVTDHVNKNVEIARNLKDYWLEKQEELMRKNTEDLSSAKERRKQIDEEQLKLRMLKLNKWDIVRAKEKEMKAHLTKLKSIQAKN